MSKLQTIFKKDIKKFDLIKERFRESVREQLRTAPDWEKQIYREELEK